MTAAAIDAEKLSALAADIDRDLPDRFSELQRRLTADEGLKLIEKPKGSGLFVATMAGISGESLYGPRVAVDNWAAAARRALLEAGAAPVDSLPAEPEA